MLGGQIDSHLNQPEAWQAEQWDRRDAKGWKGEEDMLGLGLGVFHSGGVFMYPQSARNQKSFVDRAENQLLFRAGFGGRCLLACREHQPSESSHREDVKQQEEGRGEITL